MKSTIHLVISWAKLFSVQCRHDYFRNGLCGDLEFIPTEQTALAMRNYQLVFRPNATGFSVLYKNTAPHLQPILRAPEDLKFVFQIRCTDHRFWHYTDVPFLPEFKALYFSNQQAAAAKSSERLLHAPGIAQHADIVSLRPKRFLLDAGSPVAPADVVVLNSDNKAVDWQSPGRPQTEKASQFAIHLGHYPDGKYLLKVKGAKDVPIYAMDNPASRMGMLEIFVPGASESHRFVQKGKLQEQQYTLHFQNRSTYWKYFLLPIGREELSFSEVQVSMEGEKLAFSKPEAAVVGEGKQALVIESEKPIPLTESLSDTEKLEVKLKKGDRWLSRPVKIEKPGIDMVKPDRQSKKIFSTVYAYI